MTSRALQARALLAMAAVALAACGGGPRGNYDPEVHWDEGEPGVIFQGMTVDEVTGCSTSVVRGLSQQLVDAVNCARVGTLVEFSHPRLMLGSAVFPYLQENARIALVDSMESRAGTMTINSAYRTLAQQYLLYTWYQRGQCGISLAARPGRSNHESGLAIDTSQYNEWMDALEATGWFWLGANDPVHFDYEGGGTVLLTEYSVLAFQQLWNRNNPQDLIDEDGLWGPQSEARMRMAPADGFPYSLCSPFDVDAGVAVRDASVPDGAQPPDAGSTGEDAGSNAPDGGFTDDDGGFTDEDGGSAGDGIAAEELNDALWALLCTCTDARGSPPGALLLLVLLVRRRVR